MVRNFCLGLFLLLFSFIAHATPAKVPLDIILDWQGDDNFAGPLHVKKTIDLDLEQKEGRVVLAKTKIVNNLPVTIALIVKPLESPNKNLKLKFLFVQYGFDKKPTLITEPILLLANGHPSTLNLHDFFKLKITSHWQV